MTLNTKKAVPKVLIDSLLADYKKPEDLIGENGLLKQLTKLLVERALAEPWNKIKCFFLNTKKVENRPSSKYF